MPGTAEGTGTKVLGGDQALALVGFGDIVFSVILIDEHLSAVWRWDATRSCSLYDRTNLAWIDSLGKGSSNNY